MDPVNELLAATELMNRLTWQEMRRAARREEYERTPWIDGSRIKRQSSVVCNVQGGAHDQNFAVCVPDDREVTVEQCRQHLKEIFAGSGIDFDDPTLRLTVVRVGN